METADIDPMDAEVEDEEASPKTVDGKKKESSRDKSEREYAQFLQRGYRTQGHTNSSIGSVHTVWKLLVMCRKVVQSWSPYGSASGVLAFDAGASATEQSRHFYLLHLRHNLLIKAQVRAFTVGSGSPVAT